MITVRRSCITLVAVCVLVLCACGGGSQPSPSGAPSPGTHSASQFVSSDFTTSIPSGWADETTNESAVTAVSVNGTVLMLLIAPATYSNRVNEHIDVSIAAPEVPEDQISNYLQSAGQNGARDLSPVQPFSLAGSSGLFITYTLTAGSTTNKAQDMVVDHGNNTYEIVLNTAASDFDSQFAALQQVLNSWKWTS